MKRHFVKCLGGLHHDEEGTTITEFVLLLPVFITIFAGMLNLSRLQHNSVEAHVSASKRLWDQAIPVQKDEETNGFTNKTAALKTSRNAPISPTTTSAASCRTAGTRAARWATRCT